MCAPTEDPIIIDSGTFAWESGEPTLRNINLRVKDGSLIAVVGVVGSGKSSILSAMLGELEKTDGRVNTKVLMLASVLCYLVCLENIRTYLVIWFEGKHRIRSPTSLDSKCNPER
jgi:ABC-type polysaccharide/polyol phosphate transport system ATPase subunit